MAWQRSSGIKAGKTIAHRLLDSLGIDPWRGAQLPGHATPEFVQPPARGLLESPGDQRLSGTPERDQYTAKARHDLVPRIEGIGQR